MKINKRLTYCWVHLLCIIFIGASAFSKGLPDDKKIVKQRKTEGNWQRFEKVMKIQKVKFVRLRGKFIKIHMVNIKNALKETGIKGILIIDLCNKNGTILKKLGIFKDSSEIPNEIKMSDIFAKEENRSFSINLSYLTSNRQAPMGRLESSMHFYVDPEKFNLKEIKFGPDYKSVFDTTSFDIAPDFRIRKVDRKIRKEP